MCRTVRLLLVTCLMAAFITIPWRDACAGERGVLPAAQQPQSLGDGQVWRSALTLVPSESLMMRQSVASTNESKLLLGLIAGTAIVAGVTMLAYGATSSCKGGNTTATCERIALMGAVGLGAGSMTLVLWSLSR